MCKLKDLDKQKFYTLIESNCYRKKKFNEEPVKINILLFKNKSGSSIQTMATLLKET